ncbi:putative ATPase [Coemansia guatemalensis]|uniref:ATPase n=1 Tax=Coemansia guatemalensis TaxID=2761395 RepID=A0A9W8LTF5_9FUNG|nr:putative ATPase [Coemansia guatemalensis]
MSPAETVSVTAEEDAAPMAVDAVKAATAAAEANQEEEEGSEESLRELRERALAQYSSMGEEKQRMQRLDFLLEKSAAYVSFIAQRLESKRAEKQSGDTNPKPARKKRKRQSKKGEEDATPESQAATPEAAEDEREINGERVSQRQPREVTGGVMREYQLEGMEWMASLYENGLNGILADEMGLGKTLQTIAFLCFLRERQVWGPFLVLCPLSTLANWASEFYRFAPQTPVLVYHGLPEERTRLRQRHLRAASLGRDFPVVLTTYEIAMRDRPALQKLAWKFVVVDEGHRLKNMNCKLMRDLKALQSANRLLLTGTPLQNSLSELWSLLNFLLPDIFDDLDCFQAWFDLDDITQNTGNDSQSPLVSAPSHERIVSKLHRILQPFLLRRLKSDVEKLLPPKREYLISCPIAPLQFEYYSAVRGPNLRAFLEDRFAGSATPNSEASFPKGKKLAKKNFDQNQALVEEAERFLGRHATPTDTRKSHAKNYADPTSDEEFSLADDDVTISDADGDGTDKDVAVSGPARLQAAVQVRQLNLQFRLMQQRKVCQHPYLFDFPVTTPEDPESPLLIDEMLVRSSGKLLLLDRLLPSLFADGHRVLIFSQFARMLDILECYAELRNWQFCRIDGSVTQTERQDAIVRFNTTPDIPLFFLTTRSGGLGINLTAADTVVIFDSDWNPQLDLQAQDRVHRIGQKNPVLIYRLAIAGSCELAMIERAKAKRRLEKLVIHERRFKGASNASANAGDLSLSDIKQLLLEDDAELVDRDQSALRSVLESLGPEDTVPCDLVLSDSELAAITDRSPEAYQKMSANPSSRIAQVEDAPDERNDMLANMESLE